jgi:hypothetical protein
MIFARNAEAVDLGELRASYWYTIIYNQMRQNSVGLHSTIRPTENQAVISAVCASRRQLHEDYQGNPHHSWILEELIVRRIVWAARPSI